MLDTTRADHLSICGYPRNTTPHRAKLATDSSLYENAVAPAPWTLPSHASMFTGLFPSNHQVTSEHQYLRPELETLAEILSRRGCFTVGLSCNSEIGSAHGMNQGFEKFFEVFRRPDEKPLDPLERVHLADPALALFGKLPPADKGAAALGQLAKRTLDRWEREDRRRPFFMFVNYMEPHLPYDPPEPYRSMFSSGPERPMISPLIRTDEFSHWVIYRLIGLHESLVAADYRRLADHYDGLLRYTDARLEELIEDVARRGVLDDTIVVVVGDHGENLGEHGGLLGHAFSMHKTVLHVPLVVRYPKFFARGVRLPQLVTTVSLFSTLLGITGSESPNHGSWSEVLPTDPGRREINFAVAEYSLPAFELSNLATQDLGIDIRPFAVRQTSIQDARGKLVVASDGRSLYFDYTQDPEENAPIDSTKSERARGLGRSLEEFLARPPKLEPSAPLTLAPLDPATYRSLKALGYVN